MAIEYEIDITTQGNELNIETTENELSVESQELELTLSRIGPQGPPGESSDIFFSNIEILSAGSNPTTQPSEWSQEYPGGTVVYYMAIRPHDEAAWEVVGFPATLTPGVPVLATDPAAPGEGDVWFNTTEDDLKYYDGTNIDVVADTKDLATFEDRTLDTPVEYRLDEIEYDTREDGHQHDFLFKFENDLGQIGEKVVSTQAPIADGRPATNDNFTDGTDEQRYVTVATVKHWANNEFVEDTQVLTSNDPDTAATNTNIVSAAWLKAQWTPTKTPAAGTVPDSWDNISGDATIFSATAPTNPEENQRWVQLTTGRQYVWTVGTNANYWRQLSGLAQSSAGEALTITASEIEGFFTDGSGDRGVTYAVVNDEIVTTVNADSSKQDNITLTAGTSGATFLNNVLDLSNLSGGDVTAAAVAALFNDSSASRGVSYSATSNNKIDTVVNADDTKQDILTGEDIVGLINGQGDRINAVRIGSNSNVNNAEFAQLDGINTDENIQTQLDGKQASGDYLLAADETVKSVTVGSSGATFTSGALDLSGIMGGPGGGGLPNYGVTTATDVGASGDHASSYTITHPNPGTAARFLISFENEFSNPSATMDQATADNIQSGMYTRHNDNSVDIGSWDSTNDTFNGGGSATFSVSTNLSLTTSNAEYLFDIIATGDLTFGIASPGSTRYAITWLQAS